MIAAVGVDVLFFRPTPSPVLLASFSRRSVGLRSDLIGSLLFIAFRRVVFSGCFSLTRSRVAPFLSCFSAGPALCVYSFPCTACFAVGYVLAALAWSGCAGGAARLG